MVNTCHEKIYKERGIKFYGEFYSDLEYDETGYLVIAKEGINTILLIELWRDV